LQIKDEEKKIADELLGSENTDDDNEVASNLDNNVYIKKFAQLKRYLKQSESRFVSLEQANLRAIKQVYSLLTGEQKLRLIRKCFIFMVIVK
jgi:hypothetical protein